MKSKNIANLTAVIFSIGVTLAVFAEDNKSVLAQNGESDRVKSILFKARDFSEKSSFKSEKSWSDSRFWNGKVVDEVIYRTYENDKLLERHETIVGGSVKWMVISNSSGFYYLSGDGKLAIKNETSKNHALFWNDMFDRLDWNYNCTYSMTEEKFDGIPCYKITMKSPEDKESMARMMNKSLKFMRENEAYIRDQFLAIRVFWVGQNNNFIYSYALYNPRGQKISFKDWGKVEFMNNMDKSLFAIPAGITPVTVKSSDELNKIYRKYYSNLKNDEDFSILAASRTAALKHWQYLLSIPALLFLLYLMYLLPKRRKIRHASKIKLPEKIEL